MGTYLVVHPVGPGVAVENLEPIERIVEAESNGDASWICSWYNAQEGKIFSEWDARDPDAVRAAIERAAAAGVELPVEGVYPVEGSIARGDFR